MTEAELLARLVPTAERLSAQTQALSRLTDSLVDLIAEQGDRELTGRALRLCEDALARMKEHTG